MATRSNNPFSDGSFVWFLGVVEDINDPEGVNRVRARAVGFHTEDRAAIPHDMLPWAPFLDSASAMSGPMVLPGDWVVGFFLDGNDACQQPVIFGSMRGIPAGEKDPSTGFNDPSGTYPRRMNEPTTSPLARGKDSDGVMSWKKGSVMPGEPTSPAAAQYPHNHVIETDGLNIIELDDTPGAERVHIFHKSGTFYEVHPDGTLVVRSVADAYEAVVKNKTLYVAGELKIQSVGNLGISTTGDLKLSAGGGIKIAAGGSIDVGARGKGSFIASGPLQLNGSQVLEGVGSDATGGPDDVPPPGGGSGFSRSTK